MKAQLKVNNTIHKSGFKLESEIRASVNGERAEPASVDTGLFKSRIKTDNSKNFSSTVFTPLKYPIFLEYGTKRIKPRRHFRNSFARKKPEIIDDINKALRQ